MKKLTIQISLSESSESQEREEDINQNQDDSTRDYHPTNGCITVKETDEAKAFLLMEEALNAHPDIECDWIDGIAIEYETE